MSDGQQSNTPSGNAPRRPVPSPARSLRAAAAGGGPKSPTPPAAPGNTVAAAPGQGGAGGNAPPPRRPGEKPFIPFVKYEDIVVRCGHVEKFGHMPDNKDRFRDDRRKKALSRDCKTCREKKQIVEQEAAAARKAEKDARKAADAERAKAEGVSVKNVTGRLPHGAHFDVKYDGEAEKWTGTLSIPVEGGEPIVFTHTSSGLFPLLKNLDTKYRATQG